MKIEIRSDVREYILAEVNETLSRLGVSEKVEETIAYEDRYYDQLKYKFESEPIRQMPMIFRKLIVQGCMVAATSIGDDSRFSEFKDTHDVVCVSLEYGYKHFDNGENGCSIGRMIYLVDKNLPPSFESSFVSPSSYIIKAEGLMI